MGRRFWAGTALYAVAVTGAGTLARTLDSAPLWLAALISLLPCTVALLNPALSHPGLITPLLPIAAVANALLLRWAARGRPAWDRRAVQRRLDQALLATAVVVTPMARPSGIIRQGRTSRYARSLLLRDVPVAYRSFAGLNRDVWTRAGMIVEEQAQPLVVTARDAEGYQYRLEEGPGVFGDALLTVATPPSHDRGLLRGAIVAGVPCLAFMLITDVLHTGRASGVSPALLFAACTVSSLLAGTLLLGRTRSRWLATGLIAGALLPQLGWTVFHQLLLR
jgi:hypothetical protein